MIERWRTPTGSQIAMTVAAVLVLVLIIVWRPGGPGRPAETDQVDEPAAQVDSPSEEDFCLAYRTLASLQGQYVANPDDTGAAMLEQAADDQIAMGVPASMRPGARDAFLVEIDGIYGSLGLELDPSAVAGATLDPQLASTNEFSVWLGEFCPGW